MARTVVFRGVTHQAAELPPALLASTASALSSGATDWFARTVEMCEAAFGPTAWEQLRTELRQPDSTTDEFRCLVLATLRACSPVPDIASLLLADQVIARLVDAGRLPPELYEPVAAAGPGADRLERCAVIAHMLDTGDACEVLDAAFSPCATVVVARVRSEVWDTIADRHPDKAGESVLFVTSCQACTGCLESADGEDLSQRR